MSSTVNQLTTRLSWLFNYLKNNRRAASIIIALLLLGIFNSSLKVVRSVSSDDLFTPFSKSDFEDYLRASRMISAGEDPYQSDIYERFSEENIDVKKIDPTNPEFLTLLKKKYGSFGTYIYPPFFASILTPLTAFDYRTAAAIYQLISFGALLLFLYHLFRIRSGPEWSFKITLLFSLIALFHFLDGNSSNGNVSFFLILLCGSGIIFSENRRPLIALLGGSLVGVAMMIKITPVFIGLLFLAGRRYLAIIGMGLGLVITFLFTAGIVGWDENLLLSQNWYDLLIKNFSKHSIIRPWANNQTISAAMGKLFLPGSDGAQALFGLPFIYANQLPPESVMKSLSSIVKAGNFLLYLSAFALSIYLFFTHKKTTSENSITGSPIMMGMLTVTLLASLVGSGVSWYHAYSILFIPFYFRLQQLLTQQITFHRIEKLLWGCVAFFGSLYLLLPGILQKGLSIFSIFAWSLFVLSALLAVLSFRRVHQAQEL